MQEFPEHFWELSGEQLEIPRDTTWEAFGQLLENRMGCSDKQCARFLIRAKTRFSAETNAQLEEVTYACCVGKLEKQNWDYSHHLARHDENGAPGVESDVVPRNMIIAQRISKRGRLAMCDSNDCLMSALTLHSRTCRVFMHGM